jgi:hypothetical protein
MEMNNEEKVEVSSFTDALDSFIVFAEKILHYSSTGELNLLSMGNKSNAIQSGLSGYRGVYNKTRTSPKHVEKFKEVYDQCRTQFLKEVSLDEFMEWFDKKGFTVTPQVNSRNKIHLTIIFRNCIRIAENIAAESEKHPEKAEEILNDPAAVYPEHFMLYLFRIFYHCADETDRQTMINPQIEKLETTLGLRQNELPPVSESLTDMLSYAKETLDELDLGFKMPSSANIPKGMNMKQILDQAKTNPEAKKFLKDAFQGVNFNDPKNLPNAIGKLLGKMTDNANSVPEAVKRANEATSENTTSTCSTK